MSDLSWNEHVRLYPYFQEGVHREKGLIVGENNSVYPKLFRIVGKQVITWKDGINGDVREGVTA